MLLYYGEVYEAAEDAMLELIDYCYRKLLSLRDGSTKYVRKEASEMRAMTTAEETEM